MDDTARALQWLLLHVLLPLWMLAGLADWACHRQQRIEHSAGLKETLLHWLMLMELGVGILVALLLQVNAATLLLMLAACIAHELTMWWDLSYASSRRVIPAVEQWVHGVQLALPWVGWFSLAALHPQQAMALFDPGAGVADWQLQLKTPQLPMHIIVAVLVGACVLVLLPFAQELWRCLRRPPAASDRLGHHQVEHDDQRAKRRNAEHRPDAQEAPVVGR
jgi:hypothetical protein